MTLSSPVQSAPRRAHSTPLARLEAREREFGGVGSDGVSEPTLKFTRAEYDQRLAKARGAMERAGIDLLIVTDPSNMHWLTGYDGWSFYVNQCVLVPGSGEPIWYGREQDANGARRTAWLGHDSILGYPDHYVQSTER